MKNKFLFKIILFVAASFILWFSRESITAMWTWISDRETITASMKGMGIWAPLVLCVLFILQVFLAFIPGQALMVASGYLYGFWGGFLLSWLSLVIGGEAAFLLARRYGRAFAERWISPNVLARWDKSSAGQGVGFFTLSLVMPLVPNDAMCYVAGLGKISHHRFSTANLLGRGIASAVICWIGAYGTHAPTYIWFILVSIVIALASWVLYKKTGYFPQTKANHPGRYAPHLYPENRL
ncbi:MAG TPA: TVP38/TMEM64 family protein [Anaerolineales bacterium]|nr:TVP38/TMEM64 family protein [Anaerolineales bacterium]